jgi:hypothetical protein
MVVAVFVCYLIAHFALYAAVFRRSRITASEKGIFLYHFIPAASWVVVLGALAVFSGAVTAAHIILIGSLHGIYSLSLLELWALADGGYSLAIMDSLESRKDLDQQRVLSELEALGTAKKQARLADLINGGLVTNTGGLFRLTSSGRIVATAIAAIVQLTNASMSH